MLRSIYKLSESNSGFIIKHNINENDYDKFIDAEWDSHKKISYSYLYGFITNPKIRKIGLYDDNELVATAFYFKVGDFSTSRYKIGFENDYEIDRIDVSSKYFKQGIGSLVIKEIVKNIPVTSNLLVMPTAGDTHLREFYRKNKFIDLVDTPFFKAQRYMIRRSE